MTGRRRAWGELARFIAVGLFATGLAIVVFNVLTHGLLVGRAPLGDQPIVGYLIANCLSMVVSYHATRTWVFPHRPPQHADGGWTAYATINIAAMAAPVACLGVSRYVLGLDSAVADNLSANVIGVFLGFLARFYLFRRFVFPHPGEPEVVEPAAVPT